MLGFSKVPVFLCHPVLSVYKSYVNKFFFLDFFNFCWVFQKFPFFLCHPVLSVYKSYVTSVAQGSVKIEGEKEETKVNIAGKRNCVQFLEHCDFILRNIT